MVSEYVRRKEKEGDIKPVNVRWSRCMFFACYGVCGGQMNTEAGPCSWTSSSSTCSAAS